jgi:hypothetical protein
LASLWKDFGEEPQVERGAFCAREEPTLGFQLRGRLEGSEEGSCRTEEDLRARDFDSRGGLQRGVGAQGVERFQTNPPGEAHAKAKADSRNEAFVEGSLLKPLLRLLHPAEDQWPSGGRVLAEGFRAKLEEIELFGGQVAAAGGKVFRQIAQDVDQLEALTEEAAVLEQSGLTGFGPPRESEGAKAGPEFSDTSRDSVGVVVEFVCGAEGGGALCAGVTKAGKVGNLSPEDDAEEGLNFPTVGFPSLAQLSEDGPAVFRQSLFSGVAELKFGETLLEGKGGERIDGLLEGFEGFQTQGQRHAGIIREGVAGPGEQVRQPERGPEISRQKTEGEMKGAGDRRKQIRRKGGVPGFVGFRRGCDSHCPRSFSKSASI